MRLRELKSYKSSKEELNKTLNRQCFLADTEEALFNLIDNNDISKSCIVDEVRYNQEAPFGIKMLDENDDYITRFYKYCYIIPDNYLENKNFKKENNHLAKANNSEKWTVYMKLMSIINAGIFLFGSISSFISMILLFKN